MTALLLLVVYIGYCIVIVSYMIVNKNLARIWREGIKLKYSQLQYV